LARSREAVRGLALVKSLTEPRRRELILILNELGRIFISKTTLT
jgi:hypothetical protein